MGLATKLIVMVGDKVEDLTPDIVVNLIATQVPWVKIKPISWILTLVVSEYLKKYITKPAEGFLVYVAAIEDGHEKYTEVIQAKEKLNASVTEEDKEKARDDFRKKFFNLAVIRTP